MIIARQARSTQVLTTSARISERTLSPMSGAMSSANCWTVARNRFSLLSWPCAAPQSPSFAVVVVVVATAAVLGERASRPEAPGDDGPSAVEPFDRRPTAPGDSADVAWAGSAVHAAHNTHDVQNSLLRHSAITEVPLRCRIVAILQERSKAQWCTKYQLTMWYECTWRQVIHNSTWCNEQISWRETQV